MKHSHIMHLPTVPTFAILSGWKSRYESVDVSMSAPLVWTINFSRIVCLSFRFELENCQPWAMNVVSSSLSLFINEINDILKYKRHSSKYPKNDLKPGVHGPASSPCDILDKVKQLSRRAFFLNHTSLTTQVWPLKLGHTSRRFREPLPETWHLRIIRISSSPKRQHRRLLGVEITNFKG